MIFILVGLNCYAQRGGLDNINLTNSKGQKDGYWIEQTDYGRFELYYKNGARHGIYKEYSKNGILQSLGEYNNGEMSGTWYHFGKYGHLTCIFKDLSRYEHRFNYPNPREIEGVTDHKCYAMYFHYNGIIMREGVLLFQGEWESDFNFEYGQWKYYDESGKLIKTKEFK